MLTPAARRRLVEVSTDALATLLRACTIELLVLNGKSVVTLFEMMTGVRLRQSPMEPWSLPRQGGAEILGVAYHGELDRVDGTDLDRRIRVVGYNHNLQSSFGVTAAVIASIAQWLSAV
jgi:hypothetical protein